MATERRPWPAWAADGYYWLRTYSRQANKAAAKALEVQHENVYLTARLLSHLGIIGSRIAALSKELQLHKTESEYWPQWVSATLRTTRQSGQYLSAGAKHGLDGINLDGDGDQNWKQVLKGINTCVEHAQKIENALQGGPPPQVNFGVNDLLKKTTEMGDSSETESAGRWRRRRQTHH